LRIVRERRLADEGATLEALGLQLENRALEKLKAALLDQQAATSYV
jgi:RNA polymerase sigma-32 factor